jgi:hypothetical protein
MDLVFVLSVKAWIMPALGNTADSSSSIYISVALQAFSGNGLCVFRNLETIELLRGKDVGPTTNPQPAVSEMCS